MSLDYQNDAGAKRNIQKIIGNLDYGGEISHSRNLVQNFSGSLAAANKNGQLLGHRRVLT